MARKKLGEILIEAGLIDQAGLRSALSEQSRWGGPLGRILIELRLVSEAQLVSALSKQISVQVVDLDAYNPAPDILALVPADMALDHTVVPFARSGKFLDLAMADPTNAGITDELRIRTQLNIRPYLAGPKSIERALARWYGRGPGMLSVSMQRDEPVGAPPPEQEFTTRHLELDTRSRHHSVPPPVAGQAVRPQGPGLEEVFTSELRALQTRITKLEGLVARDEQVLRKLLALLVDKSVATREEILERLR